MRRPLPTLLTFLTFSSFPNFVTAQAPYVAPTDTAVVAKLERWKDLKFGLLMHWGP